MFPELKRNSKEGRIIKKVFRNIYDSIPFDHMHQFLQCQEVKHYIPFHQVQFFVLVCSTSKGLSCMVCELKPLGIHCFLTATFTQEHIHIWKVTQSNKSYITPQNYIVSIFRWTDRYLTNVFIKIYYMF